MRYKSLHSLAALKHFCTATTTRWNNASFCKRQAKSIFHQVGLDAEDKQGPFHPSSLHHLLSAEHLSRGKGGGHSHSGRARSVWGEATPSSAAAQLPAVGSSSCASAEYRGSGPCWAQKAGGAAGCPQERRHPAPGTAPFYAWSPRGPHSRKSLFGREVPFSICSKNLGFFFFF